MLSTLFNKLDFYSPELAWLMIFSFSLVFTLVLFSIRRYIPLYRRLNNRRGWHQATYHGKTCWFPNLCMPSTTIWIRSWEKSKERRSTGFYERRSQRTRSFK